MFECVGWLDTSPRTFASISVDTGMNRSSMSSIGRHRPARGKNEAPKPTCWREAHAPDRKASGPNRRFQPNGRQQRRTSRCWRLAPRPSRGPRRNAGRRQVEGELKASADITIDSSANVQASIEGSNVSVWGQVTGKVIARRLAIGGSGRLNGDVNVGRLSVEDGATLNGNVTMSLQAD